MSDKPATATALRGEAPGVAGPRLDTTKLRNRNYLKDKIAKIGQETRESEAKWYKDNPNREPGTSTRTWKSFSRVKYASEAFRQGYDGIRWKG